MTATLEAPGKIESVEASSDSRLREIADKALNHQRLSAEDGLYLLTTPDGESVRQIADAKRRQQVGDTVYFASTQYIHPTNLCELSCPMCSFYAKPGWESAWFNTPEQIESMVKEALPKGVTEIHFVGGLWRECDLDYYKDAFGRIKNLDPNLHIKALTPVEYHFLSELHGISVREVFERMMDFGLGSLPGGGAEILVESIRKQVAPQKITSEQYMEIHGIAHELGLNSNITMLFGHVEDEEHIITHLEKVRELQDRTNGFQTFVPLRYHDENNALGKRKKRLKPKDVRRVYAVSRLMLDNVHNIKVLWNYLGVDTALDILNWGGNDFGSTALDEKIIVMAGGGSTKMDGPHMAQLIEAHGRKAKQVHSGYDYTQDRPSSC